MAPFMDGQSFRYDFNPNPVSQRSFTYITVLTWRLSEFCHLVKGLIPGFDVKLSHLGVGSHDQWVFKSHGLILKPNGKYTLIPVLAAMVRFPVFTEIDPSIFDLA